MRRSNSCGQRRVRRAVRWPTAPASRRASAGAACALVPGSAHVRRAARTAHGPVQRSARRPAISAAPSGAPCTSWPPALVGAPRPMTVRQTISVGRPSGLSPCARAFTSARSMAVASWPSMRADDVPAVGAEARRRVVGEPALHIAVDGDAVVVVERDQLVQPQRAGQRTHLVADAFHQAAVAQKDVGCGGRRWCGRGG